MPLFEPKLPRMLILMRHALADRSVADFERPLTPVGQVDAWSIGVQLKGMDWVPTEVVVTSAIRTQQTWAAMRDHLAPDVEPCIEPGLFRCRESAIEARIQQCRSNTLMVIAHNPAISRLTARYMDITALRLGTGWTVVFERDGKKWNFLQLLKPKSDWEPAVD